MSRRAILPALALVSSLACGAGGQSAKSPEVTGADGGDAGDGGGEGGAPPTTVCTGADLDLVNVLVQSACEVPNLAPDAKLPDVSALLDVKATVSPAQVAPGGHADIVVTYTNKSPSPLSLNFLLDPTPRFTLEVYTSKNNRAEMPKTKPPPPKGGGAPSEPTAPGTARVTIAPGGRATARLDFNAVKLKWAPELVRGTPPELGYPTSPAGPLPKGAYVVKVITPLIGIFEGMDHEVSTVKANVTVQ